ncbi:hypothetical protein P170DRAFT_436382, partial [Aspergillus steynii IBT 23096]
MCHDIIWVYACDCEEANRTFVQCVPRRGTNGKCELFDPPVYERVNNPCRNHCVPFC